MAQAILSVLLQDQNFRKYCQNDIAIIESLSSTDYSTSGQYANSKYQELLSFIGQIQTQFSTATGEKLTAYKSRNLLSLAYEKIHSSVYNNSKFILELDADYVGPAPEQTNITKESRLYDFFNWWAVTNALFFNNDKGNIDDANSITKSFVELVKKVQLARLRTSADLWKDISSLLSNKSNSTDAANKKSIVDLITYIDSTDIWTSTVWVNNVKSSPWNDGNILRSNSLIGSIATAKIFRSVHILVECVAFMVFGLECLSATLGKLFPDNNVWKYTNNILTDILFEIVSLNSNRKIQMSANTFSSAFNVFVVHKWLTNISTKEEWKTIDFLIGKRADILKENNITIVLTRTNTSPAEFNLPADFVISSFRELKEKGPTWFLSTTFWTTDTSKNTVNLNTIISNIIVRDSFSVTKYNGAKFQTSQKDLFAPIMASLKNV